MRLYRVFACLSFASWRCLAAWGDARMRLYRWVSRGLSFASWRCLAAWGDARMRLYRGFRVVCLARLGMRRGMPPAVRGWHPPVCVSPSGDYSSPLPLSSGGVTGSSLPSSPPPGWPGLSSSLSESPLAPPWPAEVSGAFDFWPMTSRL